MLWDFLSQNLSCKGSWNYFLTYASRQQKLGISYLMTPRSCLSLNTFRRSINMGKKMGSQRKPSLFYSSVSCSCLKTFDDTSGKGSQPLLPQMISLHRKQTLIQTLGVQLLISTRLWKNLCFLSEHSKTYLSRKK